MMWMWCLSLGVPAIGMLHGWVLLQSGVVLKFVPQLPASLCSPPVSTVSVDVEGPDHPGSKDLTCAQLLCYQYEQHQQA